MCQECGCKWTRQVVTRVGTEGGGGAAAAAASNLRAPSHDQLRGIDGLVTVGLQEQGKGTEREAQHDDERRGPHSPRLRQQAMMSGSTARGTSHHARIRRARLPTAFKFIEVPSVPPLAAGRGCSRELPWDLSVDQFKIQDSASIRRSHEWLQLSPPGFAMAYHMARSFSEALPPCCNGTSNMLSKQLFIAAVPR